MGGVGGEILGKCYKGRREGKTNIPPVKLTKARSSRLASSPLFDPSPFSPVFNPSSSPLVNLQVSEEPRGWKTLASLENSSSSLCLSHSVMRVDAATSIQNHTRNRDCFVTLDSRFPDKKASYRVAFSGSLAKSFTFAGPSREGLATKQDIVLNVHTYVRV